MTVEVARRLGYVVTLRPQLGGAGRDRWFVAPAGTPDIVQYGHPYATEADALAEVEQRVAYRLKTDIPTLRQHLTRVLVTACSSPAPTALR